MDLPHKVGGYRRVKDLSCLVFHARKNPKPTVIVIHPDRYAYANV